MAKHILWLALLIFWVSCSDSPQQTTPAEETVAETIAEKRPPLKNHFVTLQNRDAQTRHFLSTFSAIIPAYFVDNFEENLADQATTMFVPTPSTVGYFYSPQTNYLEIDLKAEELVTRDHTKVSLTFAEDLEPPFQVLILQDGLSYTQNYNHLEGQRSLDIYPSMARLNKKLDAQFKIVKVGSEDNNNSLQTIDIGSFNASDHSYAIRMKLNDIFYWDSHLWRQSDYEFFQVEELPNSYFLRFSTYDIQSDWLTRLAFFVEKKDSRGTVISQEQAKVRKGWNAHDYRVEDIVRFFNEVNKFKLGLTQGEQQLQDLLMQEKLIVQKDDTYKAQKYSNGNEYAVLTIADSSSSELKYRLFRHEFIHGLYFTYPELRSTVSDLWDDLPEEIKHIFTYLLEGSNYDISHDYLVKNEYFAFLFERPLQVGTFHRLFADSPPSYKRIESDYAILKDKIKDITGQDIEDYFSYNTP